MKTLKDKKKFGWKSDKSKNRKCKKFGYSFDKYNRKYWRAEIKRIRHKLLKHIPISEREISDLWYNPYFNSEKLFGISYNWTGSNYFNEWIEQIFNKINNR